MEFSWAVVINFITVYGMRLIASLLIFIIGKKIAQTLTGLIVRGMQKSRIDETITRFVYNLIYGAFLVVIILAALSNLGINTTSFLAVLGTAGLAIGLALQGTLSNVGAGILLVFFRPFRIGNTVQIAGESGIVEEINLFSVVLKSFDNKQIIIPNSAVIGKNIVNFSTKETRRIDMTFNIAYDNDLLAAKNALQEVVEQTPKVLQEPSSLIAVGDLTTTSVRLIVRVWVKNEDYSSVNFDILERAKLAFDAKGIRFSQSPLTSQDA